MHIEMGDDGRYSKTDIGTVTFKREFGSPLTLKYVMYVPGLKKNLVSLTMLEDHGYDVIFSKGKAFLHHIASVQVKQIRVQVKNLYKLDVEYCVALSTKEEKVQSRDIGELWHRILGHLHHEALKIMQQISIGIPKLHGEEELLAPKEEPRDDVEQPYAKEQRVETPTHAENSRDGRKHTREAEKLMHDARENVGAPTSQHRKWRSPDQHTSYIALMSESVEVDPSSFEEVVQQPMWVDSMVEYDSIIRNNFWEVVPRPTDKSVVSSKWLYKVKQAIDGSVEKHKAIFVARGFSQVEGIDYEETFAPVARYSSIISILALSA
eukprot:PITA_10452